MKSSHSNRVNLDHSCSRRSFTALSGAALGTVASAAVVRKAHAGVLSDFFSNAFGDGDDEEAASSAIDAGAASNTAQTTSTRPQFLANLADDGEVQEPMCADNPWAADLSNVINASDSYLTDAQAAALQQYGFVEARGSGGNEFFERYEMNRYGLTPNFVTVDSMVHTYHLYFQYLLKTCESTSLSADLLDLSDRMYQISLDQLNQLAGTEWEAAANLAVGFFAVGALLIGSMSVDLAQLPAEIQNAAGTEIALISEAAGIADSPMFGDTEDYSQYIPRGYYAGNTALEAYFRTMMWYGRRNFAQKDDVLNRAALLITLGLATPDATGSTCASEWEAIYQVTSFFAGTSDDLGYYEYLPLAQQAYGEGVTVSDLPGDDAAWQQFTQLAAQQDAPQINSIVVYDEGEDADHLDENKGFRFMGQRFSIDASIFQQLIYSNVGEREDGSKRMLPDVLDIAAALGSTNAHAILETQGDTTYPNYEEHLAELQTQLAQGSTTLWKASLYAQWLNMLRPLLHEKGTGYPNALQGDAWARKDLQTFSGSYAELKHDTVLYAKQVMAEAGGDGIEERDDRGYVEPEPAVFGRLAALVQATSDGLSSYNMISEVAIQDLSILYQLSTQLQTIANKELRDELPTDDEFELIRGFGAQIEHFWEAVHTEEAGGEYFTTQEFPAAIVTDIATDPNGSVLEIGTGTISNLNVIVPVDGVLRIASGPVYSFYQFTQPIDQRLTDATWRQMLGIQADENGGYLDYSIIQANRANTVSWVHDFEIGYDY